MKNTQKPEKDALRTDGLIEIIEVFKTIQGEGPFSGTPATFIRMAGCSLQCPFCDTQYTEGRYWIQEEDLIDRIVEAGNQLVVLTGGEPFRQNLRTLTGSLVREGFKVQIETNGISFHPIHPLTVIVCSPKTSQIHSEMGNHVDAWKYVLSHDAVSEKDGLPTSALGMNQSPARPTNTGDVYLQPCDTGDVAENRKNLDAVLASCMKFGHRLQLQTHKLIGLP